MKRHRKCTIFCDPEMNESDIPCYLITYYPYYIMGSPNPDFDKNSGLILDLKESKRRGIKWAFGLVNPHLGEDFAISVVPSHDAQKTDSPLKDLAKLLVKADSTRIDAADCLVRHTTIGKLAHGGERSVQVHLDSIRVVDSFIIEDKQVLVLDDVQTTGNSLRACVYLMKKAGARIVKALSIAKTAGY